MREKTNVKTAELSESLGEGPLRREGRRWVFHLCKSCCCLHHLLICHLSCHPSTGLILSRADGAGKDDGIQLFSSFPPADRPCLPFLSQRIEKSTEKCCSVFPVLPARCRAPGPCALAGLALGTVVCSVVCIVCSHDSVASVV